MSGRISDERLAELKRLYQAKLERIPDPEGKSAEVDTLMLTLEAVESAIASRELEKQLRALADEVRSIDASHRRYDAFSRGAGDARRYWLERLSSLLSAHGSSQPEAKS